VWWLSHAVKINGALSIRAVFLDTATGAAVAGGAAITGGVVVATGGLFWLDPVSPW
jgi:hypothetical protein